MTVDVTDPTAKESLAAPVFKVGALGWMRENLFSSWFNSILTIISLYVIWLAASGLWDWGVVEATWSGENRRVCYDNSEHGACWAGVFEPDNFRKIFYGRFPGAEMWRVNAGIGLGILWLLPIWLPRVKGKIGIGATAILFYPFIANYFFSGGEKGVFWSVMVGMAIVAFLWNTVHSIIGMMNGSSLSETIFSKIGMQNSSISAQRNTKIGIFLGLSVVAFFLQSGWELSPIPWTKWGGMHLTLIISGIGVTAALPGGIILALGRRSKMPVIRLISITIIEVFRSVPLITVLFMATTMFPLFMPEGFAINKLVQVIVAVCLFSSCYMAETVRAGLQAIPKGQYEGAHAIGLSYWQSMSLIIMPQALKFMIPNIVGSFIGAFKDTVLVSIIGLFDVLSMTTNISVQPAWRGLHKEPLVFLAAIFFVACYGMSKYSQHLEKTIGGGKTSN